MLLSLFTSISASENHISSTSDNNWKKLYVLHAFFLKQEVQKNNNNKRQSQCL